MKMDLSFKDVCDFIKEDDPKLIETVDSLLGLVLIMIPLFVASSAAAVAPALGLLGVKNELTKLGKRLFKKISEKKDTDILAKYERMQVAYCLICYTGFFEAVDKLLPQVKKIGGLKAAEKLTLSKGALARLQKKRKTARRTEDTTDSGLFDRKIPLPHPADSFDDQKETFVDFYEELTKGFLSFLECLAFWESAKKATRDKIHETARKLPQAALKLFEAQYYTLATKYEEFYVWSQLHERKKTQAHLKTMSAYVEKHVKLAKLGQRTVDLGFEKLADAIKRVPHSIDAEKTNKVLEELAALYSSTIEEPIIKDEVGAAEKATTLTYPKKSKIFIPQAFKVIRHTGKEQLEKEATWEKIAVRNNMGAFLLSYLGSPYSCLSPLIILGHPGCGKSLLTNLLAARLICPLYTPIRVELRGVNAENAMAAQIEDQIGKDLNGREAKWASLSDQFDDRPALLLLDGYDELLQASGKVFSGYLRKVQEFQENEMAIGRKPVRAIVTSRITLIDKAEIPKGATIVRLLEFDENKRKKWISVWNSANRQYFAKTGVKSFQLPRNGKKITSLAKQPLLLLMLALYDSEDNELRKQKELDQTVLYNSLLRRFVERERKKSETFRNLDKKTQDAEIEKDMERLGVAAIGMLNRRSLCIKASQLDGDIAFFDLEREVRASNGRTLSQADLLLGSFFFVYESKAAHRAENAHDKDIDVAFEFLHNTFGEFLAADFILRKVLGETFQIYKLRKDVELKSTLENKLASADAFPKEWYSCLMYTALFSRPIVLDMMREWLPHCLNRAKRTKEDFLNDLDAIVSNQVRRILTCNNLPSIMTGEETSSFLTLPVTGHVAIYSLNLILLRTVLSEDGLVFDEDVIGSHEDCARPWDRLANLWRSWFSLENLTGLTAILKANRADGKIHLKAKRTFSTPSLSNRLDSILNVSVALADNVTAGLSGLLAYDSLRDRIQVLDDIEARLDSENINLTMETMTKRIRTARLKGSGEDETSYWGRSAMRVFDKALGRTSEASLSLFSEWVRSLGATIGLGFVSEPYRELLEASDRREWHPELAIELLWWFRRLGGPMVLWEFYEALLYGRPPEDWPAELVLEMVRCARAYGDLDLLELFHERYFHRRPFRDHSLQLALERVKLARRFGDQKFLKYFYRHWFRTSPPEEWSLELCVEMVGLARKFRDKTAYKVLKELVGRRMHPRSLSMHLVVEMMRFSEFMGDTRFAEVLYDRYFSRRFRAVWSLRSSAGLLKLMRECSNRKIQRHLYDNCIRGRHAEIGSLPISFLADIRLLAKKFRDSRTLKEIEVVWKSSSI